jgi:hypothetical protein
MSLSQKVVWVQTSGCMQKFGGQLRLQSKLLPPNFMVHIPDYNSKCNQLTVAITLIQMTNVIHITSLNLLHYAMRPVLINFVGPLHIWTYKTSFPWKVVRKLACTIFYVLHSIVHLCHSFSFPILRSVTLRFKQSVFHSHITKHM